MGAVVGALFGNGAQRLPSEFLLQNYADLDIMIAFHFHRRDMLRKARK